MHTANRNRLATWTCSWCWKRRNARAQNKSKSPAPFRRIRSGWIFWFALLKSWKNASAWVIRFCKKLRKRERCCMNVLVAEWALKAEGDLIVAERELRARKKPIYDACCYHSQQSAEKYLKAFLVSKRISPPRTHNLVELLKACLHFDGTFDLIRLDVESL